MMTDMTSHGGRTIRILGAGVAGLTAAVNLAREGFAVEVYERRDRAGLQSKGDLQGLENWTSPTDVLAFLDSINIPAGFPYEPFNECQHYDHNLREYPMRSSRVGFYLIRRGPMPGTLDSYLVDLAIAHGVTIRYGVRQPPGGIDVIATGCRDAFLVAKGINFETNLQKTALAIFDDRLAPFGYAYLLGWKGLGTIAIVSKTGVRGLQPCLERAIERFGRLCAFEVRNPITFGGFGGRYRGPGQGTPLVGEAGGFQDAMWGFGLRMAFHTGYLAARSIVEGIDYWSLVRQHVAPLCRSSVANRMAYDLLRTRRYTHILSSLACAADPVARANKLYAPGPAKSLLYLAAGAIVDRKRWGGAGPERPSRVR